MKIMKNNWKILIQQAITTCRNGGDKELFLFFEALLETVSEAFINGDEIIIDAEASAPYTGCFREPNFWLLDINNSIFTDLYVSHRLWKEGTTFPEWLGMLLTRKIKRYPWHLLDARELRKEDDSLKFIGAIYLQPIALNYIKHSVKKDAFSYCCTGCEKLVCVSEKEIPMYNPSEFYGVGGLAVGTNSVYCSKCRDMWPTGDDILRKEVEESEKDS